MQIFKNLGKIFSRYIFRIPPRFLFGSLTIFGTYGYLHLNNFPMDKFINNNKIENIMLMENTSSKGFKNVL